VKDRSSAAKRDCEKIATTVAAEHGLCRDDIWVSSRRHPNQAHIDLLEPVLAMFFGENPLARLNVDDSQVRVVCHEDTDVAESVLMKPEHASTAWMRMEGEIC
jgi:hypothetical protein